MREVFIALSSVVLSGGLVTALWTIFRDRRRAPIEQRDTHIAAADTIQQMALRTAERAEATAARAEADAAACRSRIEALERSHAVMEQAQTSLRSSLIRWEAWWGDLAGRWEHHRAQDLPPHRPARHPDVPPDDGQDHNLDD